MSTAECTWRDVEIAVAGGRDQMTEATGPGQIRSTLVEEEDTDEIIAVFR